MWLEVGELIVITILVISTLELFNLYRETQTDLLIQRKHINTCTEDSCWFHEYIDELRNRMTALEHRDTYPIMLDNRVRNQAEQMKQLEEKFADLFSRVAALEIVNNDQSYPDSSIE